MRVALGILALLYFPASAGAERRLDAEPAGVHVSLEGPVALSGTVPLPVSDLPAGEYRLQAGGPGTAVVRGRLWRGEDATLRGEGPGGVSAFFLPPGAAHFRNREGWRGWLWLGGAGIGAAGAVLSEGSRRGANDDADRALDAYRQATGEDAIRTARLAWESALDESEDQAEMRDLWAVYGAAAWLGAAVESAFLTAGPGFRVTPDGLMLSAPRAGGAAAALRSLAVPGAGQRWLGREGRGNLMTGAVLLLGAGSLVAQDAFLDARREQEDAQRRYDRAETVTDLERERARLEDAADRTDRRSRLRWTVAGAAAGVYLWNVIDAWQSGGEAGRTYPPSPPPLGVSVVPRSGGVDAALSWRMP